MGIGLYTKHMPEWCLKLNKRQSNILLNALIDTDGTRELTRVVKVHYTIQHQKISRPSSNIGNEVRL